MTATAFRRTVLLPLALLIVISSAAAATHARPGVAAAANVAPEHPRQPSPCQMTWSWQDSVGTRWTFTRCADTMTVNRSGGPLPPCSHSYPVGAPAGTHDLCGYPGPI